MQIITDIEKFRPHRPLSITIGKFDGLHKGHELLIKKASSHPFNFSGLITFDINPRRFFMSGNSPCILTTEDERMAIFKSLNIDYVFLLPFLKTKNLTAYEFVNTILAKMYLSQIFVGTGFLFGKSKIGDVPFLKKYFSEKGVAVKEVEEVLYERDTISSSRIRTLIEKGDVEKVADMMIYPYSVSGDVKEGKKLGRKLFFPTLNISEPEKIIPQNGIYITATVIDTKIYKSVTNIGYNPTTDKFSPQKKIETNIIGYDLGNIYGKRVTIYFFKKLRNEIKFSNFSELSNQVFKDIEAASLFWKDKKFPKLIRM